MLPISLSTFSAFEFLSDETVRDLDLSPLQYVYTFANGGYTEYHFIEEDGQNNGENNLASREYQFSPSLGGISLNSTPHFYPEEEIAANFHADAEMHNFLSPGSPLPTLPSAEYKKCRLHLISGFSLDADQPGLTLTMFVKKSDGSKVYLTSIYDNYQNSSIKITASPIIHESAIYNQSLDFEVVDLDFLYISTDVEIVAWRDKVFGADRPSTIFFEFSTLIPSNVDTIIKNSKEYVKLNLSNINTQQIGISAAALDLFVDLKENNGYISSELKHSKFNLESYLAKLKDDSESYTIVHKITANLFNASSDLVGTLAQTLGNTLSIYDNVTYRPVVESATVDHIEVVSEINVENNQTGSTIRRQSKIVIADTAKYDPNSSILSVAITTDELFNQVTEEVNQIVLSNDTPQIVQIDKNVFIQIESALDTLTLLPHDFTAKINVQITDSQNIDVTYLKIGGLQYVSEKNAPTTFTIKKQAYYLADKKYFITNSEGSVINYGVIERA